MPMVARPRLLQIVQSRTHSRAGLAQSGAVRWLFGFVRCSASQRVEESTRAKLCQMTTRGGSCLELLELARRWGCGYVLGGCAM